MSSTSKSTKPVELVTDVFGIINCEKGGPVQIKRFTWRNTNRIQVQLITYGATITSIKYPNRKGIIDDVVLGFDEINSYLDYGIYNIGSTIGRYANYIKNSHFNLMKKDYYVKANLGRHHYNGGKNGFDQAVWNNYINGNKVVLSHLSPDNDEGYPGDVLVFATFELTSTNEFRIEYKAMSSKPTIINIANHSYFNLGGHSSGPEEVNKHTLLINADCHTVTNNENLPTGEIQAVIHTIYDLQRPVEIGELLGKLHGVNNNFCINKGVDQGLNFVARLHHASSGRMLEIYSNQYGVQFDTANNLPLKTEIDTPIVRTARSPYLKAGITTFDMLDEIHNKIVDVIPADKVNDYRELLDLIKDLQKKERTLYRTSSRVDANAAVKRASLTLDTLVMSTLTQTQKKYLERIIRAIKRLEESSYLNEIKETLQTVVTNNKHVSIDRTAEQRKIKNDVSPSRALRGKKGAKYFKNSGICLQSQNYPDAINNLNFPNCILKPGSTYVHNLIFKFWIKTDQSGISGVF